ncbi:MAG TPA: CCA tRNA nucleotidyltransferase, partial [Rhodospirillales bacterium]|nr:CCA tRNA nucleotidyltransferase [Rhodospirillales bacterium]
GCVRDSILKMPVTDVDIATPDVPERVIELLEAAGIKVYPTGIDHGTITAVIGEHRFEVTTLRIDLENYGRHAKVAFTDDWVADALRRDFTINTLSCTVAGDIYDPIGGLEDLGDRRIKFVGVARDRIEEDILRLLRFFRMQAVYGRPPLDIDALAACRLLAPRLTELSAERISAELFRILAAPNPADTLLLMQGVRVLEHILPEAVDFGRLRMISWLKTTAIKVDSVEPDNLRRLAAVIGTSTDNPDHQTTGRLRLSNQDSNRLAALIAPPITPSWDMDQATIRRALHNLGADEFRDLTLLAWAAELAAEPRHPADRTDAWLALIDAADTWTTVRFPLSGQDALDLGMAPGPTIGQNLKLVESWWQAGDFRADHDQCLARLKDIVGFATSYRNLHKELD